MVPSPVLQHSVHWRPPQEFFAYSTNPRCCDCPGCRIHTPWDKGLVLPCFGDPRGQHHHALLCGPTTREARFQCPATRAQDVVRSCSNALGKFMGTVPLSFCGLYGCHIVRCHSSLYISGDLFTAHGFVFFCAIPIASPRLYSAQPWSCLSPASVGQ